MGTRSNIVRQNADGSFDDIYCHWNGQPQWNGRTLLEHYSDPKKINKLLSLGSLSSLGEVIGRKHSFDRHLKKRKPGTPEPNDCTFYGRDRGETGQEAQHYDNLEAFKAMLEEAWTEWVYIFKVTDGKWYYMNNPSETWFKCCPKDPMPLTELTPAAWFTPSTKFVDGIPMKITYANNKYHVLAGNSRYNSNFEYPFEPREEYELAEAAQRHQLFYATTV